MCELPKCASLCVSSDINLTQPPLLSCTPGRRRSHRTALDADDEQAEYNSSGSCVTCLTSEVTQRRGESVSMLATFPITWLPPCIPLFLGMRR